MRGGGWLNECNAQNQILLIRAYGPLRVEALITMPVGSRAAGRPGLGSGIPAKAPIHKAGCRGRAAKSHPGLWALV